jgi:restriction endonuclease Mrr
VDLRDQEIPASLPAEQVFVLDGDALADLMYRYGAGIKDNLKAKRKRLDRDGLSRFCSPPET